MKRLRSGRTGNKRGYSAQWLNKVVSVVQPRHSPTSASVSSSLSLHAGAGPLARLYAAGSWPDVLRLQDPPTRVWFRGREVARTTVTRTLRRA